MSSTNWISVPVDFLFHGHKPAVWSTNKKTPRNTVTAFRDGISFIWYSRGTTRIGIRACMPAFLYANTVRAHHTVSVPLSLYVTCTTDIPTAGLNRFNISAPECSLCPVLRGGALSRWRLPSCYISQARVSFIAFNYLSNKIVHSSAKVKNQNLQLLIFRKFVYSDVLFHTLDYGILIS